MFDCINCESLNVIYLGKGKPYIIASICGPYHYLCKDCGELQWSSHKEKTKLKWYKEKEFVTEYYKNKFSVEEIKNE